MLLNVKCSTAGKSSDAILLWEPLARRLKQVIRGNLVPVHIDPPCDEWLAADATGLIGWSAEGGLLRSYGSRGGLELEIAVEGTPLAADLAEGEVWLQRADRVALERYRPEPLKASDPRFRDMVDHMEWLSVGMPHRFTVERDEVVVTAE